MKRPNVKRMQKHAARSVSDRTFRRFSLAIIPEQDQEFLEWKRRFENKMRLKHGHEPEIKVTAYSNAQTFQLSVELRYEGRKQSMWDVVLSAWRLGTYAADDIRATAVGMAPPGADGSTKWWIP